MKRLLSICLVLSTITTNLSVIIDKVLAERGSGRDKEPTTEQVNHSN